MIAALSFGWQEGGVLLIISRGLFGKSLKCFGGIWDYVELIWDGRFITTFIS